MPLVTGSRGIDIKYVYDLPYTERKFVCDILDINNQWERLGGTFMDFKVLDLEKMRQAEKCGDSPTDRLLQSWGHKNNTVLKLYQLLYEMQHYQAMSVLTPFVPEKYHILQSKTMFTDPPTADDLKKNSHCHPVPPVSVLHNMQSQDGARAKPVEPKPGDAIINGPQEDEGKVLNVLPSPRRKQSHSCEENITEDSLAKGLNEKMDFDKEYRDKVNAKYGIGVKPRESEEESPCKISIERISQKATRQLRPPLIQVASDVPPNSAATCESINKKRYQFTSSDSSPSVPSIPYEELENATDSWRDDHLLGKGGFGFVYKGIWKNTKVAIKKINQIIETVVGPMHLHISQTLEELHILQQYRHDNILQVFGFSADEGKPPCLVYQFMPFGSLEDRLQCRKIRGFDDEGSHLSECGPLNWRMRFNIAYGTATALQFLHTVQKIPLIHGDIKSANILLDRNFEPRLGDFGLARKGPRSQYTSVQVSRVHGTRPYIPDEYLRNKRLSTKVDSFSFGIVMFELATGYKAYDEKKTQGRYLKDLVQDTKDKWLLIDKKAGSKDVEVFEILFKLGMSCINRVPKERPEMKDAFKTLEEFEKILKEQEQARSKRISLEQVSAYPPFQVLPFTGYQMSTSPSNNQSYMILPPPSSLNSSQFPPPFHGHRNGYPTRTVYKTSHISPPAVSYVPYGSQIRTAISVRAPVSNHLGVKHLEQAHPNISEGNPLVIPSLDQSAIVEESSTNHYRTDAAQEHPDKDPLTSYSSNDSNLPLLTGIGVKPSGSFEKEDKMVSSQGKNTVFNDSQSDDDDDDDDDSSSSSD